MKPQHDPQRSLSEALDWLIELREAGNDDPRHHHWQTWLGSSEHNRQAWQRVESLGQRLGGSEGRLLLSALRSTPAQPSRRAFLGKLCLLLGGTGALAYSGQRMVWPGLGADYHTGTGERHSLELDNHLKLELNTATALDISQDSQGTRITLVQGEIMVDTRQALSASTRVVLPQAQVWAGQARFSVRALEGEQQRVCVYQGQVSVSQGSQEFQVSSDQQVLITPGAPQRGDLPVASDAWTRGLLISDGMPLELFARELNRYRRGMLHCDPSVAALRVSGSFDLTQPEQILATLGQVLPVKVEYRTRYWATLVPAA